MRRYIDFLRRSERAVAFDPGALEALRTLADEDHAWSLITLGNLYADGVGVKTNYRRARKLLRDAALEAADLVSLEASLLAEMREHLEYFNQGEALSKELFGGDERDIREGPQDR